MQIKSLHNLIRHITFIAAFSILVFNTSIGESLNNLHYDFITNLLALKSELQAKKEPVLVVGIDENSFQSFPEPMALWHQHLADFLHAAKLADAKVVGLDIILPERSYNFIMPNQDEVLAKAIIATNLKLPVILGRTIDGQGNPRSIYRKFELVSGEGNTGYALFALDSDGVVRKYTEKLTENGQSIPTLVGQMIRAKGGRMSEGFIDFNVGGKLGYVPIQEIIRLYKNQDIEKLSSILGNKYVLLGTVLPTEDRIKLPLNVASWESNNNYVPGVLLHAQTLKSIVANRIVTPISNWISFALILLCTLLWTVRSGVYRTSFTLVISVSFLFLLSIFLYQHGYFLPLGMLIFTVMLSCFSRVVYDAIQNFRERALLRKSFSGAVSPALMEEILEGKFNPKLGGERTQICVLFADIRGFTTLSEENAPEYIIHLLNRYFEGVVEVIHKHSGVVLCFMGDGIMAAFGAPKSLASPEISAFKAAQGMQEYVKELNRNIATEGNKSIQIGVGIHSGEAIVGHVGSSTRSDYTVIGDVANLASRLEGMTKELNCSIAFSERVNSILLANPEFGHKTVDYGVHQIKGRSAERIFGWTVN